MRKFFIVILLSTLLLTSCNFPLAQSTPDADTVATRVAETLMAALATPLSTAQDQVLPTIGLNTPEPTGTPTITPTATTAPGDPKLTLGSPSFLDTFTSGSAFGLKVTTYEDDAVLIKVENGAMIFRSYKIKGGKRWRLTSQNPRNLYLEGTFTTISCSGGDNYGLVLRSPTYGDGIGYYFGISCDGQYYVQRWDGSGLNTVVNLSPTPIIISGSNQTNRIGIMAQNDQFKIYINGTLIQEFTDGNLTANGYIGAFSSALSDPGFTVQMDEIALWNLP